MNAPEQPFRQLPVADDVVVKTAENVKISGGQIPIFNGAQFLYSSTQEIADKLEKVVVNSTGIHDFFTKGINALCTRTWEKLVNRNNSGAFRC